MGDEVKKPAAEEKHRDDVITKKQFAEELQKVVAEETGHKISKEASWELFKALFKKCVDLACVKPISLAGVGKFVVQKTKPRGSKVGKVAFVPRFKLRASSAINAYVEAKLGVVSPNAKPAKEPTPKAETPKTEAAPIAAPAAAAAAVAPDKSFDF